MLRYSTSLLALSATVLAINDGCTTGIGDGPLATKYVMDDALASKGAACLDGTPGAYYHLPGSGTGANKWYIHHQGGGWCESIEDCFSRSKGNLGSSKAYPAQAGLGGGYFDTDSKVNPMMYNWNHVFMRYCDGGSFSGNNETTQEYNGTTLHWRGSRIRESFQEDLFAKRGLDTATDVVISGCSAGGLATYLHTDQWCDAIKTKSGAKCVGLPDSGFFLDYQDPTQKCTPNSAVSATDLLGVTVPGSATDLLGVTIPGDYHCGLKWTYTIQNASSGVNQDCIKAHTSDNTQYECMFAEHSSEHIHTPLFAMQSQYDSWQTGHVLFNSNPVQEMGNNITSRIQSMLMKNNNESGAFLDSCHHHCGAWNSIQIDGDLVSGAIQKWYNGIGQEGNKVFWNENKKYPCDACCKP